MYIHTRNCIYSRDAISLTRCIQLTDVTMSENPRSHSLVTVALAGVHRYTHEPRPTARTFCEDQSIRFR